MGADLPEDRRAAYQAMRRQISSLEFRFQQHLNEDTSTVTYTLDELAGCQSAFVASLASSPDGTGRVVALKPPHILEVMQNAHAAETRRRLVAARDARCADVNLPVLLQVLHARQEAAELAGFASHAAFRLHTSMAETPAAAEALLYALPRSPAWRGVYAGRAA